MHYEKRCGYRHAVHCGSMVFGGAKRWALEGRIRIENRSFESKTCLQAGPLHALLRYVDIRGGDLMFYLLNRNAMKWALPFTSTSKGVGLNLQPLRGMVIPVPEISHHWQLEVKVRNVRKKAIQILIFIRQPPSLVMAMYMENLPENMHYEKRCGYRHAVHCGSMVFGGAKRWALEGRIRIENRSFESKTCLQAGPLHALLRYVDIRGGDLMFYLLNRNAMKWALPFTSTSKGVGLNLQPLRGMVIPVPEISHHWQLEVKVRNVRKVRVISGLPTTTNTERQ
eukprot:Gb_32899 [translate_table: standard]